MKRENTARKKKRRNRNEEKTIWLAHKQMKEGNEKRTRR